MNLVTFKSINVERLEFIKSVSLRLFCVNTQGYLILASCVLFSFSEGPTFASHMGKTVSARIVPVLLLCKCMVAAAGNSVVYLCWLTALSWSLALWLSCILCSFLAFTSLPAASAEGSPIPILFFNNWPFWPVIFCDNCLWEDDFSISFIRHTKDFGICYVSQGILKRLGSGWRELKEALSIYALPRSVSKPFHFALATPVDKRPSRTLYPSTAWKRSTESLVFQSQNPSGYLYLPLRFGPWGENSH